MLVFGVKHWILSSSDAGRPSPAALRLLHSLVWCWNDAIAAFMGISEFILYFASKLQASQTCQVQSLNFYCDILDILNCVINCRLKIHVSRLKAISYSCVLVTRPCCSLCSAHASSFYIILICLIICSVWGMAEQRTAWIWHGAEARGLCVQQAMLLKNLERPSATPQSKPVIHPYSLSLMDDLICLSRWKYMRSETDQAFWCRSLCLPMPN